MRQSRMCPVCFLFGQLACVAEGVAALDGLMDEVEVLGLAVQDGLTDDLAVFGRTHFHHADERQGGLALTQVVADVLAQGLALAGVVEHIVDDLEGGAQVSAVGGRGPASTAPMRAEASKSLAVLKRMTCR